MGWLTVHLKMIVIKVIVRSTITHFGIKKLSQNMLLVIVEP